MSSDRVPLVSCQSFRPAEPPPPTDSSPIADEQRHPFGVTLRCCDRDGHRTERDSGRGASLLFMRDPAHVQELRTTSVIAESSGWSPLTPLEGGDDWRTRRVRDDRRSSPARLTNALLFRRPDIGREDAHAREPDVAFGGRSGRSVSQQRGNQRPCGAHRCSARAANGLARGKTLGVTDTAQQLACHARRRTRCRRRRATGMEASEH